MPAAITIGGTGPFQFSAAHAGLHDGEFEPLHGHTFTVTLRLHGELDGCGMVADFQAVKKALIGGHRAASPPHPHAGPAARRALPHRGQPAVHRVRNQEIQPPGRGRHPAPRAKHHHRVDRRLAARPGLPQLRHGPVLLLAELILAEAPTPRPPSAPTREPPMTTCRVRRHGRTSTATGAARLRHRHPADAGAAAGRRGPAAKPVGCLVGLLPGGRATRQAGPQLRRRRHAALLRIDRRDAGPLPTRPAIPRHRPAAVRVPAGDGPNRMRAPGPSVTWPPGRCRWR